ncbi:histidinol-phosphate transaminase [Chitinispirillales bacterium ANBcel5]|uniref:pyridoxal phosphate-dependent aminotransferase n=1 Tax=Cellulosispirillum alkaliphilum TaxID=3039283 RepID=UPI002A5863E0|nr:histidinol-phosphate transaminase [Chitinispirillales bacterium ANBcel5]
MSIKNSNYQKHGSIPYKELRAFGIDQEKILDFSATVNPLPMPQSIRSLFSADGIKSYPDPDSYDAINALSNYYNLAPEMFVITAGVTETIFILPQIANSAIQFVPTYGDYQMAFERYKKSIISLQFPASEKQLVSFVKYFRKKNADLLIVCNPNNPDGLYLTVDEIEYLCRELKDSIICVDESYQEMGKGSKSAVSIINSYENLILLKSLTKPFGIGGLRIGYTVSSAKNSGKIRSLVIPWGVSGLAQKVIPAVLDHIEEYKSQWNQIHKQKESLIGQIERIGIPVEHGVCPFFLIKMEKSVNIRLELLRRYSIAVRDCSSFSLEGKIRLMPSVDKNNRLLLEVLREFC